MGKKLNFIALSLLTLFALLGGALTDTSAPLQEVAKANPGDIAWMIVASAFVLLMTPGLAFFYGGMVDRKNVISTMLQSFVALGVISVVWVVVGFSLCFGDSLGGIIGNPLTFLNFRNVGAAPHPEIGGGLPFLLFALFQLKFAIITPALFTGSMAGRIRFRSYILFMVLFTLFFEMAKGTEYTVAEIISFFCRMALGGPAFGILFGYIALKWIGACNHKARSRTTSCRSPSPSPAPTSPSMSAKASAA